jgi:hypothetical protein
MHKTIMGSSQNNDTAWKKYAKINIYCVIPFLWNFWKFELLCANRKQINDSLRIWKCGSSWRYQEWTEENVACRSTLSSLYTLNVCNLWYDYHTLIELYEMRRILRAEFLSESCIVYCETIPAHAKVCVFIIKVISL